MSDVPRGPERAVERAAMLSTLVEASHLTTLEQLPDLVNAHAGRVGVTEVRILLADLQQDVLTPLTGEPPPPGSETDQPGVVNVEGTVAGRAFQHGKLLPASPSDHDHWWVPLVDGTDRLGVLWVAAPGADAEMLADMLRLAGVVALLVVSKRTLSDSYDRLVRRRRMNTAAEMEWRLMPPRTFATDHVMISAVMEPAYEVSGDAYDYAFDGHLVRLAIFDAMGHDTAAGLTANLALSAFRNTRRQGASLAQSAGAIDQALLGQFHGYRFVTGILACLDLETGVLEWLNCGHPTPFVIRDRVAQTLVCRPTPPLGTGLGLPETLCSEQLEPGDRLMLFTDGITEARSPAGEEFGFERFADFLIRHEADELPVPETLRRLVRRHLEYHQGRLRDDASALLLEWHGRTAYRPGEAEDLVGLP